MSYCASSKFLLFFSCELTFVLCELSPYMLKCCVCDRASLLLCELRLRELCAVSVSAISRRGSLSLLLVVRDDRLYREIVLSIKLNKNISVHRFHTHRL